MPESKRIGKYEILEEIGHGGKASVYRARDTELERVVALKVLHPYWSEDPNFVTRFRREAQTVLSLRHPNIVTVYEAGEAEGKLYTAMERLPGRTLRELLEAEGALSLERALPILDQLADALDYAHKQGVIHRDVKPVNVMVEETERGVRATLTDFGLVKAMEGSAALTSQGTLLGSPEYMAPEQADPDRKDQIGPATDRYALGIVAYQMLTGQVPFPGNTASTLVAHVRNAPPDPRKIRASLSGGAAKALLKALSKAQGDRYPSAVAMIEALHQTHGTSAARLYHDARRLVGQGKAGKAQAKLDELRQIDPGYPGSTRLAAEIDRLAQLECEYAEIVKLVHVVRDKITDFVRRAPGHPDPERVLKLPSLVIAGLAGGGAWSALCGAGLALVIGGALGFWSVPAEERWVWGVPVLFGGFLGDAWPAPQVALVGAILATGMGILAALVRRRAISRTLALAGCALAVSSFVLTAMMTRNMGIEGPGPTLVLVGQTVLALGLAGQWRK